MTTNTPQDPPTVDPPRVVDTVPVAPAAQPVVREPVAPAAQPVVRDPVVTRPAATPVDRPITLSVAEARAVAAERRRVALRRFRGLNVGAAFFGWLVAVGIAVLLAAIIAAAGTALNLTEDNLATTTGVSTTSLSVNGVVLLALILLIAYFAGGYVAGRLSRFTGALQGVGVWVIGLVITTVLAVVGALAGAQYNVASQLRLPSIPVNGQSFATGGALALVAMAILTLAAAAAGGTLGLRYHRRVDRALQTP